MNEIKDYIRNLKETKPQLCPVLFNSIQNYIRKLKDNDQPPPKKIPCYNVTREKGGKQIYFIMTRSGLYLLLVVLLLRVL